MRLTHFGHSCVLVELLGARILFDPGTFSSGFESLTGLDAIALTHQHPDHADPARLPALLTANPGAERYSDPQSAALFEGFTAVHPGDNFAIGDVQVTIGGGKHAVIHPDLPVIDNAAFLLGTESEPGVFMHPGDSLFVPDQSIGVLAVPAAAPWAKIAESVDYLRAVAPRLAVPIHQAIIAPEAQGIYHGRLAELAPAGTEFRVLPLGMPVQVG